MALEVIGGAFFSSFFQQVFQKLDSQEVKNFIRGKKETDKLLKKLRIMLLSVNNVYDDAEDKQLTNSVVREWLSELKEAILEAEDLLDKIKTEALRRKLEAADGSGSSTSTKDNLERLFSMHDLVNDLAKFVSGNFCVKLEDNDSFNIMSKGKTRHFSYMKDNLDLEKIEALYEAKCMRTFLPLDGCRAQSKIFEKVLPGTMVNKMPTQMQKMKNLQRWPLDVFVFDIETNIVDLKELRELHGKLHISGLDNIIHAGDALGANMREKKYLTELVLEWGGDTDDSRKDQQVLDNMRPHTNIRRVTISSLVRR